jgi:hypothetical protein
VALIELTDGQGGGRGDGGGAKSYDGEKAWSSIIRSILSGWRGCQSQVTLPFL